MTGYKDVWVVLPDVSWLGNQHPDSMKQVIELGRHDDVALHYFTASSVDKGVLDAALKAADITGAEITAQDWMGAIPPVIIGDPHSRAHIYLFSNGRFTSNDWYGGTKLVQLISSLVRNKLEVAG